nr:hypothetical protein [uncultured bacterium]
MELYLLDHFSPQRLKGSQSDVQGNVGNRGASPADGIENRGREMQTGGGRGDRSSLSCEHSLVAFAIGRRVGTADVGRQGNVSGAVENLKKIRPLARGPWPLVFPHRMQAHRALAIFPSAENVDAELVAHNDALARAHLLARPNQCRPCEPVTRDRLGEKYLHLASLASFPMSVQTRGKHARIVQHQTVAGAQVRRKIAEHPILPPAQSAIDHQHPRGCPIGQWLLGDELFGKLKIEIGKEHQEKRDAAILALSGPPDAFCSIWI